MEGIFKRQDCRLMAYTREEEPGVYPSGLARSVHFAVSCGGKKYEALNNNYGVLFASADVTAESTLSTKSLKNPWVFRLAKGGWGIAAVRVTEMGLDDPDSRGKILLWTTENFMDFTFRGLLPIGGAGQIDRVRLSYDREAGKYAVVWTDEAGCWKSHGTDLTGWLLSAAVPAEADWETLSPDEAPHGAVPACEVSISANLYDRVRTYWGRLSHVDTVVPGAVRAKSHEDVAAVTATAVYSDGSTAPQLVDWDDSAVDYGKPGEYEISGVLRGNPFRFPLTHGTGDPVIVPWKGKFYYLSTSDTTGDVGLYIREADTREGLFAPDVKLHLILPYDEERGYIQTFWAPEFHIVGGEPYIFFALGGKVWGPQCQVMHLKPGGHMTDPDAWEEPRRVLRQDGTPLTEKGITLDMTVIKAGGRTYAAWSYRFGMTTPLDTGSMLYIAPLNEREPWKLAGGQGLSHLLRRRREQLHLCSRPDDGRSERRPRRSRQLEEEPHARPVVLFRRRRVRPRPQLVFQRRAREPLDCLSRRDRPREPRALRRHPPRPLRSAEPPALRSLRRAGRQSRPAEGDHARDSRITGFTILL